MKSPRREDSTRAGRPGPWDGASTKSESVGEHDENNRARSGSESHPRLPQRCCPHIGVRRSGASSSPLGSQGSPLARSRRCSRSRLPWRARTHDLDSGSLSRFTSSSQLWQCQPCCCAAGLHGPVVPVDVQGTCRYRYRG